MTGLDDKLVTAIIGLLAGVVGTFFAPWVNWGVERHRLRYQQRKEMAVLWRKAIAHVSATEEWNDPGELEWCLNQVPDFLALRPYLSSKTLAMFTNDDHASHEVLQSILEDIAAVERQWHLL